MTARTDDQLAPNQRLARGLKYAAVGPVDISRGVAGMGMQAAVAAGAGARRRYQDAQLRRQLAVVAEKLEEALPDVLADALPAAVKPKPKCRRRPLLIAGAAVAVLAGGAVAFSVVRRRSRRPEPTSPLPPSVEVAPKP